MTDVYQGVKVVADCRWQEDANDPGAVSWSAAQSRFARSYPDALPAGTRYLAVFFLTGDNDPANSRK